MSLGLDESKAKEIAMEAEVETNYRTLRIIWLAILAGVITLFVVTRLTQPTLGAPEMIFWILLALGVGNMGASFVLKHKMLRQATEKQEPGSIKSAYIVALVLCESVGIFGLIAYFVTGVEQYYYFFVLSGFGILLHKPQRHDLLAAADGRNIWETRNND
jgi:F0F1-type ATP synthase membrane subunit c/vacuolar-type H+-ATPase subunit K